MNIALEDVSACQKRLKIEVPAKTVDEEISRVTGEFQKAANIKGFRQGKAPVNIIKKRYTKDIEDEVKRTLVPKAFREAIQTKKLKIVSEPRIEDLHFQSGVTMSFSTIVDLVPEFSLPDYQNLKVKKGETEVTEEEVQQVVSNILDQHAEFSTVEGRALTDEDFAIIDYVGKVGNQSIKEIVDKPGTLAENQGFWLLVRDENFLPNFGKQLVGMNAGETRTISVKFPEDYPTEAVKGKEANYEVKLNQIKQKKLPELNDELAQKVAQCPAPELLERIKENLTNQKEQSNASNQHKEIVEQLKVQAIFELPESMVKKETERLVHDIVQENQARGISDDMLEEKKRDIFGAAEMNAKDRVKVGFILNKIAEEEKITVETNDIMLELSRMSQMYGVDPKDLVQRMEKNGGFSALEDQIRNRKTMDFLLQKAKVE
ncbi:MAG: trigger factor [Verrucomicrobiota bacterium]